MRRVVGVVLLGATGCASLAGLDDYGRGAGGDGFSGGGREQGGGGASASGGATSNGGAPAGPGGTGGMTGVGGAGAQGGGASVACSGAPVDDFAAPLDGAQWFLPTWTTAGTNASALAINGRLEVSWTAGQAGVHSDPFDLQDCAVWIELDVPPTGTSRQAFFYFQTPNTANTPQDTRAGFKLSGEKLELRLVVNNQTFSSAVVDFDETAMRWWRLREAQGVLYWETSPTAMSGSWEVRRQEMAAAEPVTIVTRSINVGAGVDDSTANTGFVAFDNVNIVPSD